MGAALFDYLKAESANTDIFCFQEIFEAPEGSRGEESRGARIKLFTELKRLLPEFEGFFDITSKNHDLVGQVDFRIDYGLAVFINQILSNNLRSR